MELRHYLQVVLKGWWLILSAVLISMGSAVVFTNVQTPVYRTEATFVVSPSASFNTLDDVLDGLYSLSRREGVMSTYVAVASSRTILDAVYDEMGLTEDQLRGLEVSSELVPSTNIIRVIVEANDPLTAKTCADLVGARTIAYGASLFEIYDMKPLDPAYMPKSPSKPNSAQNLVLGGVFGVLVGAGSAFLLHYLRSAEEAIAGITIIDASTGVYNRQYFLQRLGEELSRAKRHHHPLSVALMSIERLDMIGDSRLDLRIEALRRVGLFLKQYLREEDILARFEGNTFALLLPDTSGPDAGQILQRLHTRMEWTVFELGEGTVRLNLGATSGVVASQPGDVISAGREELLAQVERALQRARANGYGTPYLLEEDEEVGANRDGSAANT